jgi:dihydropyrimidinase
MDFDTIITNATVVTASEVLATPLSIGIRDGKITAIATTLPSTSSTSIIDAEGAYVTPGGIDSHVHLHQDNAPTGDKWLSGSRSALAGGNTTIIAFATQKRTDESLFPVIEEYHRRAHNQSYIDYGFHVILSNPTPRILSDELPQIFAQGITSVKMYMTYPALQLSDSALLNTLLVTRSLGMTSMIHAENADMISLITARLIEQGNTLPKFHALARPQIAETEATYRAIQLASLTSAPILIVHMSSPVALSHARKAQSKEMLPIHAETCPHYMYLRSNMLAATTHPHTHDHDLSLSTDPADGDEWAGARHVCAPPLRHKQSDLQSIWDAVHNNTITVISSDHAPSKYDDAQGKRKPLVQAKESGETPLFSQIPNGLPGLETRLPLLFDAATNPDVEGRRKLSLPKFVALTSTNSAKLYGLSGSKGTIAPGYDADIVIWYPSTHGDAKTTITNEALHHDIDYTPFEGFELCNWPRKVLLRGKMVWDRDRELKEGKGKGFVGDGEGGGVGQGQFLKRGRGEVLVGRPGGVGVKGMLDGEREMWGLGDTS